MDLKSDLKLTDVKFSANGGHVVALSRKVIQVWDLKTREVSWTIENEKGLQSMSCHPNDEILVAVTLGGSLYAYDLSTSTEILKRSTDHHGPVLTVNFNTTGNRLVTGGIDGRVQVWQ